MESANITNITIYNIKQTMRKRTLQQNYIYGKLHIISHCIIDTDGQGCK